MLDVFINFFKGRAEAAVGTRVDERMTDIYKKFKSLVLIKDSNVFFSMTGSLEDSVIDTAREMLSNEYGYYSTIDASMVAQRLRFLTRGTFNGNVKLVASVFKKRFGQKRISLCHLPE